MLPAAFFATTVSFTVWPTSASFIDTETSTVFTAEVGKAGLGCCARATALSSRMLATVAKANRLTINIVETSEGNPFDDDFAQCYSVRDEKRKGSVPPA